MVDDGNRIAFTGAFYCHIYFYKCGVDIIRLFFFQSRKDDDFKKGTKEHSQTVLVVSPKIVTMLKKKESTTRLTLAMIHLIAST